MKKQPIKIYTLGTKNNCPTYKDLMTFKKLLKKYKEMSVITLKSK